MDRLFELRREEAEAARLCDAGMVKVSAKLRDRVMLLINDRLAVVDNTLGVQANGLAVACKDLRYFRLLS